jgi:hypothetical protein
MSKLEELIKEKGVKMSSEFVGYFTEMDGDKWAHHSWKCTLRYKGRQMTTDYHMGTGHHGNEPSVADVLYGLLLDYAVVDSSFAEFCNDFGYSDDSRKAEKIYKACIAGGKKLRKLLGEDIYIFQENNDY